MLRLFIPIVVGVIGIQVFTEMLKQSVAKNPATLQLIAPVQYVEHMVFGFNDFGADIFWLRWIQDMDSCQKVLSLEESGQLGSIFEQNQHAPIPDSVKAHEVPRKRNCDGSWSYTMLDAVTRLAPRFRIAYATGAITLSVINEDFAGASLLFDRAVQNFPQDWPILYRAAYHFLFDRADTEKAAKLLNQAVESGAPEWLRALAARIFSESGQYSLALATLLNYRETLLDAPERLAEIDQRIEDIKKKLVSAQNRESNTPPKGFQK